MASSIRLSHSRPPRAQAVLLAVLGTVWLAGCRPVGQGIGAHAADAVTIAYDGNGCWFGWMPASPTFCRAGQRVAVPGNPGDLYRPGWVFRGWNVRPDGSGPPLHEGDLFSPGPVDTVLYAQWAPAPTYPDLFRNPGGEQR